MKKLLTLVLFIQVSVFGMGGFGMSPSVVYDPVKMMTQPLNPLNPLTDPVGLYEDSKDSTVANTPMTEKEKEALHQTMVFACGMLSLGAFYFFVVMPYLSARRKRIEEENLHSYQRDSDIYFDLYESDSSPSTH